MLLQDIYQTCNYISNKHKSGNAFTINQFNDLIEIINPDFFKKKVEESGYYEEGRMEYNDAIRSSKILKEFVHRETNVAVADPLSLNKTLFAPIGIHFNGTGFAKIDIITDEEHHERAGDSIFGASSGLASATVRDGAIYIENQAALGAGAKVNISYYRYPDTPILDYYIDVNSVLQFLAASESHVWATGEIDSAGTLHTIGDPNWASLTAELEYSIDFHMDIRNEILSGVGINLKEPQITQYAEAMKQQQTQL